MLTPSSALVSFMAVVNWASVRPYCWAIACRPSHRRPLSKMVSRFWKTVVRTSKYLPGTRRASRKPAAANSLGGVRNSRKTRRTLPVSMNVLRIAGSSVVHQWAQ